jgi:cell wall-associated NlpC family hydrolase
LNTRILIPRLLVVGATLLFTGAANAQSSEVEPRQTNTTVNANGFPRLETEPSVLKVTEETRPRTVTPIIVTRPAPAPNTSTLKLTNFDQSLLTAMQSHLGASYHFNRTGPDEFDCSGFVWRAFQDVGLNFQRGPASSYWTTMPAPAQDEQFKFGNLVFFSNLSHVGIVVDGKGFYHSARHGGVMYSPFNEYWLSRIDGFRRVPSDVVVPAASTKPRIVKPVQTTATIDENNEP